MCPVSQKLPQLDTIYMVLANLTALRSVTPTSGRIKYCIALIFSAVVGTSGAKILSKNIKKEAIIKVSKGLSSLEDYTHKLTKK